MFLIFVDRFINANAELNFTDKILMREARENNKNCWRIERFPFFFFLTQNHLLTQLQILYYLNSIKA